SYVNELPKPGETIGAMFREKCYGGKGANQCVAASLLGADCALIAKMGNDDLGNEYYNYLQDLNINIDYVELMECDPTGIAQINVDDNGDNSIVVVYGANLKLNHKDVSRSKKLFKKAKVLLCQLESDPRAVLAALKQFKGVSVLNAAPIPKTPLPEELIQAPTILCVNEIEAAQLTDRDEVKTLYDAKAAANDLLDKGAQSVIITLGEQGAIHLSKEEQDRCIHLPAAPVRYLADTSGAGDAFLGSLAYHIARFPNLDREFHIYAANICAAYSVGHRGTQPSFPGPEYAQTMLCQARPYCYLVPDEDPTKNEADAAAAAEEQEKDMEEKPEAGVAGAAAAGAGAESALQEPSGSTEPAAEATAPPEDAAPPTKALDEQEPPASQEPPAPQEPPASLEPRGSQEARSSQGPQS
ncbi:hypothetical protein KR222_000001, partial [Zaprionus bogoriensis]